LVRATNGYPGIFLITDSATRQMSSKQGSTLQRRNYFVVKKKEQTFPRRFDLVLLLFGNLGAKIPSVTMDRGVTSR